MEEKKSVLISFLGNINYDSRSLNFYSSLNKKGYKVQFMGFDWVTENFKTQKSDITIKKITKGKFSLLFYLSFALHLKFKLLKGRFDYYFAEDVYTLPFVALIGKFKKGKVIYDSREIFGHLAGLRKKKKIQSLLRFVEKSFIKKADIVLVTGDLDKEYLVKEYKINNIVIVRNLPLYQKPREGFDFKKEFEIPASKKILIYQGMVLHGRGLRIVFEFLKDNNDYVFIVLGDGDSKEYYKNLAIELGIKEKVIFINKVSQSELLSYTKGADVGISIIENVSLSYFYALPNKLFEYIMTEIPCIVSNLPQMDNIIKKYKVGLSIPPDNLIELKNSLQKLSENNTFYNETVENCKSASKELNWENEIEKLFEKLN